MIGRVVCAGVVVVSLMVSPVLAKGGCCPTDKKSGCAMEKKPGCEMENREGCGKMGLEALNLTDQQKKQLKDLRQGMKESRIAQMEKLRALREKTREELLKPSSAMGLLDGYAKESAGLHQQMAQQETEHLLKVKAILTQEQFGKLLSKGFWMEMGGMHRGMGGEMGPGGDMKHPGCPGKPGEACPPGCKQMKDCPKGKAGCPMNKTAD